MRSWPRVALGEVVVPAERSEQPVAGVAYRQIGVRLWGEGVYERETIDGSQTSYNRLYRTAEGDIIVNKIWARNGSVAVVPVNLVGCYASSEFPMFAPDPGKLLPRWFHWFTKTQDLWRQCDEKSRGTSGKNRIRPEKFLEITFPLPPLAEQQRIVARIDALAARIEQAKGLRAQAVAEVEALWQSALGQTFTALDGPFMTVEDVCEAIIDNLHSTPKYDGAEYPCVRSQDVGWGTLDYTNAKRTSEEEFLHRTQRGEPRKGDVVFVREGDIGRCAVVDGSVRFSLGQRVMMLRPIQTRILSEFFVFQMVSAPVLENQVLSGKTGTTSHHVNIKHVKQVKLVVPSLLTQERTVERLSGLRNKLDAVKCLQAETQAELDALLPAVLDRAFRGEL